MTFQHVDRCVKIISLKLVLVVFLLRPLDKFHFLYEITGYASAQAAQRELINLEQVHDSTKIAHNAVVTASA